MRFTVPQFIEIEDKIFGPLTWKQFLYIGGGFGLAVTLFMTAPFFVFLLVGVPVAILAAALAFFPVNNRPFSVFLESAFNYFINQREYFWHQQDEDIVYRSKKSTPDPVPTPKENRSSIASLSRKLELQSLQDEIKNKQ